MADEFCHTVLHGAKIQKAIPVNKPRPLPGIKKTFYTLYLKL